MKARTLLVMTAVAMFVIAPAVAGTTFEMSIKDGTGTEIAQGRTIIDGNRLRVDSEITGDQAGSSIVFEGGRKEVLFLSHAESKAMVLDEAGVARMAEQMKQMRSQMEQMMANVPESQRAMMENMMKERMGGMMGEPPAPVEVRKTSDTGSTDGYSWVKYEIYQGGEKIREHLVTDWSNLKVDPSVFGVFEEVGEFFQKITDALGAMVPAASENPFNEFNELNGFPVVTREFEGGTLQQESTLTAVTTGDVDAGLFKNPGYAVQKIEMPQGR